MDPHGADEWLQITQTAKESPAPAHSRPADLFGLGALDVVHTQETAASYEAPAAAPVGQHVLVHSRNVGDLRVPVVDGTAGFLTGLTLAAEPITIHLLDTATSRLLGPGEQTIP